jgi:phage/plasmid-like protein (TIGR03299 family)
MLDPTDPLSWTAEPNKVRPVRDTRTGPTFLGHDEVGTGFQFWQNEQTAEFAQQIAGVFGDEQMVTTAGEFEGGAKVFFCLGLEGFTVLGEDAIDQWLTVANGHNGSLALTATTGGTRVVCRNTFDMAMHQANKVTVRHQGDMIAKADQAALVLGVARDWAKELGEFAETLASQKMTDKAFEKIVRTEFVKDVAKDATARVTNRHDRDLETLLATFRTSPTTEVGRGTKWAAFNAITEWAEWGRPGDLTTEKAAIANVQGTGAQIRAKAAKVLIAAR